MDSKGKASDQIGVITLMRLIWKWKIVVFTGVVVCAFAALVISMLMPHVYEVDMLVEQEEIKDIAVKRKIDISEKMLDLLAEKKLGSARIEEG